MGHGKIKRMLPNERRRHILDAAVSMAEKYGYRQITRQQVAHAANVTESLVGFYFTSVAHLRKCVLSEAVDRPVPCIIAQYLAVADDKSVVIPKELMLLAADFVRSQNEQDTERI